MNAPTSKQEVPQSKTKTENTPGGWKLKTFISGIVLFFFFTGIEFWQYLQPYRRHEGRPVNSRDWWIHSLERNIDAGLPEILGNIRSITKSANGKCLWIAGDAGLLAFSSDEGSSWTLLNYVLPNGDFQVQQSHAMPCGGAESSSLNFPSVP